MTDSRNPVADRITEAEAPAFMAAPEAIRELATLLGNRLALQEHVRAKIARGSESALLPHMVDSLERERRALHAAIKALS